MSNHWMSVYDYLGKSHVDPETIKRLKETAEITGAKSKQKYMGNKAHPGFVTLYEYSFLTIFFNKH